MTHKAYYRLVWYWRLSCNFIITKDAGVSVLYYIAEIEHNILLSRIGITLDMD